MQAGWPDSTFLISAPGLPQLIVMAEIKVGKPTLQASDTMLADSQKLFRDYTCKPMAIPQYAVAAKTPVELIPMLVKIITFHMDKASYDVY